MARELTQAELDLQEQRGLLYRRLITEATADMLKHVKNPVIFLSGGIDSCSTLWAMLDNGARPAVMTYLIPTAPKRSKDSLRAEKLAKHYGLPFHAVTVTDDADEVARGTEHIIKTYEDMSGRADIEVLFLFNELFKEAARLGYDSVFSGIADGSLHLLGRKFEVAGRQGLIPAEVANFMHLDAIDDDQFKPLCDLALKQGMAFCNPLRMAAYQLPYTDLSWDLLNTPRNKEITRRAFKKEIEETELSILVQPMQCGDSGSREYFDGKLSNSAYAYETAGKEITSARVYYNFLVAQHYHEGRPISRSGVKKQDPWAIFRKKLYGMELPKGFVQEHQYDASWRALNPPAIPAEGEEVEVDPDDLFGGLSADSTIHEGEFGGRYVKTAEGIEVYLDSDGNPDTRTDCWGTPLWKGPEHAWNECPDRHDAAAGPDSYDYTRCQRFDIRYDEALDELGDVVELFEEASHPMAEAYRVWHRRSALTKEAMLNRVDKDHVALCEAVAQEMR